MEEEVLANIANATEKIPLLAARQMLTETEFFNAMTGATIHTDLKNFRRMRLFAPTGTSITVNSIVGSYTYTFGTTSIDISYPGSVQISVTSPLWVQLAVIRDFSFPQS